MSRACSYYSVRNSHLGLQGKGKHSTKQKHRVPADGTKMMHCNITRVSVNKKKQICSKTCTIAEELPKKTMLSCKVASAKNQTTNDQICAPTPHVWRKRKKCKKMEVYIQESSKESYRKQYLLSYKRSQYRHEDHLHKFLNFSRSICEATKINEKRK